MHVDLSEHLHTEECNEVIRALRRCHEENSMLKQLFMVCNDLDMAMRRCTKKERLDTTREQLENSKIRNAEIQQRMANLKHANWRDNLKEKINENKDQ